MCIRDRHYITRYAQNVDLLNPDASTSFLGTVQGMKYQGKSETEARNLSLIHISYQMSPSYDSTTSLKGVEKVYRLFLPDYVVLTFIMMLGFYIQMCIRDRDNSILQNNVIYQKYIGVLLTFFLQHHLFLLYLLL